MTSLSEVIFPPTRCQENTEYGYAVCACVCGYKDYLYFIYTHVTVMSCNVASHGSNVILSF